MVSLLDQTESKLEADLKATILPEKRLQSMRDRLLAQEQKVTDAKSALRVADDALVEAAERQEAATELVRTQESTAAAQRADLEAAQSKQLQVQVAESNPRWQEATVYFGTQLEAAVSGDEEAKSKARESTFPEASLRLLHEFFVHGVATIPAMQPPHSGEVLALLPQSGKDTEEKEKKEDGVTSAQLSLQTAPTGPSAAAVEDEAPPRTIVFASAASAADLAVSQDVVGDTSLDDAMAGEGFVVQKRAKVQAAKAAAKKAAAKLLG